MSSTVMAVAARAFASMLAGALGIEAAATNDQINTAGKRIAKRKFFRFDVSDGGTAGTAVAEGVVFSVENLAGSPSIQIAGIVVAATTAVVADNTDFDTFTASKRTGGAAATTVASSDTKAANLNGLTALAGKALPLSATPANLVLAPGDDFTFAVAKGGAGKPIGKTTVTVFYDEV